ncbi:hypothetical protein RVR_10511 [Actinacidiphila reveromycinica]|uniref:Uncharacterized protein n=1 Tax=Actinacidiphila reveromycinica TaxID=659352 RepID=A0A7U3UTR7_9ACTN|nr:hypothetical protein RVR_10511 [Streptomyces sp. SN-593]
MHAVRLNQPGVHTLTLGDHTVAVLSATAPPALGGATHVHTPISRHGDQGQSRPDQPHPSSRTGVYA